MKPLTVISLGCFLLAFGIGWYIFTTFVIPFNVISLLLIIAGTGIIATSLLSWKRPRLPVRGLVMSIIGGLLLSLFLTSGFGFLTGWVGSYKAEDTKVYTGFVTANELSIEVASFNGPIKVSTWAGAGYRVRVKIVANGISQQNAEANLDALKINLADQIIQEQQIIILNFDVPFLTHSRYSIGVDVDLPTNTLLDLDLASSNGDITLIDIAGNSVTVETTNGQLVFDEVRADHIVGETSNAGVEGTVDAQHTAFSTSNGGISLDLPCTVSGQYDLSTSNGNVKLRVSASADVGYDLDFSTSNADIDITLSGLEYTQNQKTSKEAQSEGFSNKAIQIIIEASTSNGNIDVETF